MVEPIHVEATGEFHREHVVGRRLGTGAFGSVYSAWRPTDDLDLAVKVVDPHVQDSAGGRTQLVDARRQRSIEREVVIMRELPSSRNIVKFHGFYTGEGLAYIVMERCGRRLLAYLERLPVLTEATLQPIFADMASAIAALHAAGIVHRDVKCDNFLVSTSAPGVAGFVVKLCDFGISRKVSSVDAAELSGVCGTAPYLAPELLDGGKYGAAVDVWALGVLAYVLLFGVWPYMPETLTAAAIKAAIKAGSPPPDFRRGGLDLPEVSQEAESWVRALLSRDPAHRPSAQAASHSSSKAKWCSAVPLGAALQAAVRCGAFEPPELSKTSRPDLDQKLLQLNAKYHGLSEVSTDAGAESPVQSR